MRDNQLVSTKPKLRFFTRIDAGRGPQLTQRANCGYAASSQLLLLYYIPTLGQD